MKKKSYSLENWSMVAIIEDPYKAPELMQFALRGVVYGHLRFNDGVRVLTSNIIGVDGKIVLTRSGSRYELGTVDAEYEELFPDAFNRLMKSLKRNKLSCSKK